MRKTFPTLAVLLLLGAAPCALAQAPDPSGLVRLSASARSEVANDQLSATLFVEQEHADAKTLMARVNELLSDAQSKARQFKDVEVRTSAFSTHPIYDNNGRAIRGWRARADLTLTGPLKGNIAQAVAALQDSMVVAHLSPGVSTLRREQVREELAVAAIRSFRERAGAYAQAFGAAGWELHEAAVDANLNSQPQPYPMAMKAGMRGVAESVAALPVEAGNSSVEVTVSGSIRTTAAAVSPRSSQ